MMDWTDRHCRYFHRLLTRRARLYTEMVTTGALLHGDVPRHLDFDAAEHPVALQLGGSEPAELARVRAARRALGLRRDQPQLRLSVRARAARRFGACLMAEPALVADCVRGDARRGGAAGHGQAPHRHRPRRELRVRARFRRHRGRRRGCEVFIVHARNALLQGPVAEGEPRGAAAALRASCTG